MPNHQPHPIAPPDTSERGRVVRNYTIMTLPRHREQDWKLAIDSVNRKTMRGEIKFIDMEIDLDPNSRFGDISRHKIAAGSVVIQNLISEMGLVKCRKSEATVLITVGEKINGCFVLKQHANYWLRPLGDVK